MLATFECVSCHHHQNQGPHEFLARQSWPATPTETNTVVDVSVFERWYRRKHHSPPAALQGFLRELEDESHEYGGKVKCCLRTVILIWKECLIQVYVVLINAFKDWVMRIAAQLCDRTTNSRVLSSRTIANSSCTVHEQVVRFASRTIANKFVRKHFRSNLRTVREQVLKMC